MCAAVTTYVPLLFLEKCVLFISLRSVLSSVTFYSMSLRQALDLSAYHDSIQFPGGVTMSILGVTIQCSDDLMQFPIKEIDL